MRSHLSQRLLDRIELMNHPDPSLERVKARLRWIRETKPTDEEYRERLFEDEPILRKMYEDDRAFVKQLKAFQDVLDARAFAPENEFTEFKRALGLPTETRR